MIPASHFASPALPDSATLESSEEASAAQTLRHNEITAAPSPSMPSISAEEVQSLRREVAIARAIAEKINEDTTTCDDNRLGPEGEDCATATLLYATTKLTTDDAVSRRRTADDPFPAEHDGHRERRRRRRRRRREGEDYDSDGGRKESRRARHEKSSRRRRHKRAVDEADGQSEGSVRRRRSRHRASRRHGGSKRRRRDDGNYEDKH